MAHRSSHLHKHPGLMEKPGDMGAMPSWFQRAWKQLRTAMFIGTVVAGFVMGALQAWSKAFPSKEPASIEEVNTSNADLRTAFAAIADSSVRAALASYTDSLTVVRQHIEDSVARPIYKAILDLDRRTSRIERNMVEAGLAIEEQRQTTEAANAEVLERLSDRSDNAAILQALAQIMERQDELERQVKRARGTKNRF